MTKSDQIPSAALKYFVIYDKVRTQHRAVFVFLNPVLTVAQLALLARESCIEVRLALLENAGLDERIKAQLALPN